MWSVETPPAEAATAAPRTPSEEPRSDSSAALIEEARRWQRRRRRLHAATLVVVLVAIALAAVFGRSALTGGAAKSPWPDRNLLAPATQSGHVLYLETQRAYLTYAFVVPGTDGSLRFVQTFPPRLIELRSGGERPVEYTDASWFDPATDALHQLSFVDGVLSENRTTPLAHENGPSITLAELNALQPLTQPGGYRHLLETGAASPAGNRVFAGRKGLLLDLPLNIPIGGRDRGAQVLPLVLQVVVDPLTHRPIALRLYCTCGGQNQTMLALLHAEILGPNSPLLNVPPTSAATPPTAKSLSKLMSSGLTLVPDGNGLLVVQPTRTQRERLQTAAAASALARPAVWPGETVAGLPLTNITLTKAETHPRGTPSSTTLGRTRILRITYGAAQTPLEPVVKATMPPSVEITETTNPGFDGDGIAFETRGHRVWTLNGIPIPSENSVLLLSRYPYWTIQARDQGVYLTITATSRSLALQAAKQLRPI